MIMSLLRIFRVEAGVVEARRPAAVHARQYTERGTFKEI